MISIEKVVVHAKTCESTDVREGQNKLAEQPDKRESEDRTILFAARIYR